MAKEPNQPADPGTAGESLADFQRRRNEAAWEAAGGKDGDELVVEPPTTKNTYGYSDEKNAALAGNPATPAKKSPKKGK